MDGPHCIHIFAFIYRPHRHGCMAWSRSQGRQGKLNTSRAAHYPHDQTKNHLLTCNDKQ